MGECNLGNRLPKCVSRETKSSLLVFLLKNEHLGTNLPAEFSM